MSEQKRYYYDCHLKAAYMEKYFGMKFLGSSRKSYGKRTFLEPVEYIEYKGKYHRVDHESGRQYHLVEDELYISPDCLHLLEPQEGDGIVSTQGTLRRVQSNQDNIIDETDCTVNEAQKIVRRIIQRSGLAFMWPKVEA